MSPKGRDRAARRIGTTGRANDRPPLDPLNIASDSPPECVVVDAQMAQIAAVPTEHNEGSMVEANDPTGNNELRCQSNTPLDGPSVGTAPKSLDTQPVAANGLRATRAPELQALAKAASMGDGSINESDSGVPRELSSNREKTQHVSVSPPTPSSRQPQSEAPGVVG